MTPKRGSIASRCGGAEPLEGSAAGRRQLFGLSEERAALAAQFARFLAAGLAATALQYAVLIGLVRTASVAVPVASGIGFVLGAVLNYALNFRYTFRSSRRHTAAVFRFILVASTGLALNSLILVLWERLLHFHYLFGQVVATGIVLLWNFNANRRWTFSGS